MVATSVSLSRGLDKVSTIFQEEAEFNVKHNVLRCCRMTI